MLDIDDLKEKLKYDENFKNKFSEVKDLKETIRLARQLGFEVSEQDIENDPELSQDILKAISGGIDIQTKYELINVFGDYDEAYFMTKEQYDEISKGQKNKEGEHKNGEKYR